MRRLVSHPAGIYELKNRMDQYAEVDENYFNNGSRSNSRWEITNAPDSICSQVTWKSIGSKRKWFISLRMYHRLLHKSIIDSHIESRFPLQRKRRFFYGDPACVHIDPTANHVISFNMCWSPSCSSRSTKIWDQIENNSDALDHQFQNNNRHLSISLEITGL